MKKEFVQEIKLSKNESEQIYKLLHERNSMSEDETISRTASFGNGIEMDIKVCGDDDGYPWTEAVLFKNGSEICCSEVEDDVFGEWSLEYEGNTYTTVVTGFQRLRNTMRVKKFNARKEFDLHNKKVEKLCKKVVRYLAREYKVNKEIAKIKFNQCLTYGWAMIDVDKSVHNLGYVAIRTDMNNEKIQIGNGNYF